MKADIKKLKETAKEMRKTILETIYESKSGHPGGSLSMVEILTTLYFYKLRYDAKNPKWSDRDRVVLSKGHCTPGLYTALAFAGFFPKEELKTFRKTGSRLSGHAYISVPGVDATTGSLGQGLSVGNGMAIAAKLDNKNYKTYIILGDGELQEGNVWEAAMSSAHFKLDNIVAIVDRNQIQQTGFTEKVKALGDLAAKFSSFGWEVQEIDGHNIEELMPALDETDERNGKPKVIIANTAKGKGISFMELNHKWHGVAPSKEELERALKELE